MAEYMQSVHRFWAGIREMPEEYQIFGQMWGDLNPQWRVIDWDIRAVADYPDLAPVFTDLYNRDAGRHGVELYAQIADVLGYAIIERWGGVYVDCDVQPVRPLPSLPETAWASYECGDSRLVSNSVIGAPGPHDPFWSSLLRELPKRYFANPSAEMCETTGSSLLTDHAEHYPDLITVLPAESFNSVHWRQIDTGQDASRFLDSLPEEAIGLHHWGHKKDSRSNMIETATQA